MSEKIDDDEFQFVGTGRANYTGGGATVTVPRKAVEEVFDLDGSGGVDVAYFTDGERLVLAKSEDVTL